MIRSLLNSKSRTGQHDSGLFQRTDYDTVRAFFQAHPELKPSPLRRLPGLAADVGLGDILLKDESERFGLSAFKVVGVTYAFNQLFSDGRLSQNQAVICASSGNHGRAVARVAHERGLTAKVYVPRGTVIEKVEAIANEGAEVVVSDGGYEKAVQQAANDAEEYGSIMISDTGWPGYEDIPRLIMAGYTRLLDEASADWGDLPPDVVLVQAGVGGLASAVASWFSFHFGPNRPFIVSCEPTAAPCLMESIRADRRVLLDGPLDTVMAGLCCAKISDAVWPNISHIFDACIAVSDDQSATTTRRLADPLPGDPLVIAGASGACSLACLLAMLSADELQYIRDASGINSHSRVLVFNTEGATDPKYHARAMEPSPIQV